MARIAGVDLPKAKRMEIALTYIYGIGRSTARKVLTEAGVDFDVKTDSLPEEDLVKVRRVIDACDRQGVAVILGCFYQRQDQILRDEAAVRAAVVNTVTWIQREGFTNVLLEIANEYGHRGFDHPILKTDDGLAELLRLAKRTAPRLLVSTSETGGRGTFPAGFQAKVAPACDYLLVHLNLTPAGNVIYADLDLD